MFIPEKSAETAGQDCTAVEAVLPTHIMQQAQSAEYTNMAAGFSEKEWNVQ